MANPTRIDAGKGEQAKAPEPKCPFCNAKPIRYSIVTGLIPSVRYAIVQVFCTDCSALLTAVPAPMAQEEENSLGSHGSGIHIPS